MARVRGPYHQALVELFLRKSAEKAITQDSLGRALGKDQTWAGKYFRGISGPLDLDDADAALAHIGSSLKAFIADPTLVIERPSPSSSPVAKALAKVLQGMDDAELQIVLGIARSVRTASRRVAQTRAPTHAADRVTTKRKIGGKR